LNEAEAISDRARFGLAEDAYVFLFNFDFYSTIHRKNPGAVIEAFRRAFHPREKAILVLKSINHAADRPARETLARASAGLNVVFLDDHVPRAEVNALFASADCYVSLHRSEGLGLGMAQAMYLGKPVIGTGYSGNLEFMNSENSLLVNYTMTELQEDSGPYERGTHWADPDVEHAATLMRFLFENREKGEAIGLRAAAAVRATLDPARTSAEIARRVQELSQGGRQSPRNVALGFPASGR
jgi:glycosyltransferase involved in cell wall biosynthesis